MMLGGFLVGIAMSISCATTSAQDNLVGAINDEKVWRFEAQNGGEGKLELGEEEATITVSKTTDTPWHVQALLPNLALKNDQQYTLTFELKVSDGQIVKVSGMVDQEDWHQIGLYEELYPTAEYKEYKFTFSATEVAEGKKNRISFVVGDSTGTVSLRNISLVEKE